MPSLKVRPNIGLDTVNQQYDPLIEGFLPNSVKSKSFVGTAEKEIQPSKVLQEARYVDTIASASLEDDIDPIQNDITPPQDVQNAAVSPNQKYVIETLFNDAVSELNKENANYDKIAHQVHCIHLLLCNKGAKINHSWSDEAGYRITIEANRQKKTYNTWPVLVITIVAAAGQIVGGGFGIAGVLGASGFTAFGQGIGQVGQGAGHLGQIFNSQAEGKRVIIQIDIGKLQEEQRQRMQEAGRLQSCADAARAALKTDQEARQTILRALAQT